MKNNIKSILKYIIIVIITLSAIGLALVKIFSSTLLSEAYVLKMLDKSGYYENISKYLQSNFENYIGQSGLDESVIKDIYTTEDIKNSTEIILGNIYEGTDKKVDSQVIREKLLSNINKSLEGTTITQDMQKAIDTFADTICNEYVTTMSQTKYENQINDGYQKANKIINMGQTVLCITIIVAIAILLVLTYKKAHRFIKAIGIATVSSGLSLVIIDVIVNLKVKVEHIKVLNDAISGALQSIIIDIFQKIAQTGSILLVIGIVLIILGNIMRYKKTKEK